MSHTSRSYQLAAGQMSRDGRQAKGSLPQGYLDADILVPLEREEMIDNSKIARRLAVAMLPHALIDGGEVIQHLVRPVDHLL